MLHLPRQSSLPSFTRHTRPAECVPCRNTAGVSLCLVLHVARVLTVNPTLLLTEVVPMLSKEMQVLGLPYFQIKLIMFPSEPLLWEWELWVTMNAHKMVKGIFSRESINFCYTCCIYHVIDDRHWGWSLFWCILHNLLEELPLKESN